MNRILQNHGFRVHLAIYVAVNVLLFVLNLTMSPDKWWFYWPLLGWGIGLAAHAYGVYKKGGRSTAARERPRH